MKKLFIRDFDIYAIINLLTLARESCIFYIFRNIPEKCILNKISCLIIEKHKNLC